MSNTTPRWTGYAEGPGARFSDPLHLAARHPREVTEEGTMTEPEERVRPDGRAWQEAQRNVAARNDEAQKRGREQRAKADRKDAAHRAGAERRGIYR
jgi:hypothetical protein